MHRENCTICGEQVLGGHDAVYFLESPVMSFHRAQHLACRLRAEREECAKIAKAYGGSDGDLIATEILARNNS